VGGWGPIVGQVSGDVGARLSELGGVLSDAGGVLSDVGGVLSDVGGLLSDVGGLPSDVGGRLTVFVGGRLTVFVGRCAGLGGGLVRDPTIGLTYGFDAAAVCRAGVSRALSARAN